MLDFSIDSIIPRLIYTIPAILLALTLHEFSHAYSAYLFGDNTAKNAGRLTLNPLKHLDPMGTILLIIARFGWAKPVPINPYYFGTNRKAKIAIVSFAGPLSNLLMAFIAALLIGAIQKTLIPANTYLYSFIWEFFYINLILAIFNLIPVPPLDGSNILYGILPQSSADILDFLNKYGFIILIILLFTGILSKIISPVFTFLYNIIFALVNLIY